MKIAYGSSRKTVVWSNEEVSFETLCEQLETPLRTNETVAEYAKMSKTARDEIKDKGGFVAGHLRDGRRQKDKVICRSMLVYDFDAGTSLEYLEARVRVRGVIYSTHSHTQDAPRLRLIIPLAHDISPDMFVAVARYYAEKIGILDRVDPCSFTPHQLMYFPTCSADGEYIFKELEGDYLDPESVLPEWWRDNSRLPTAHGEHVPTIGKKQQDPTQKSGIIGAVCRTYTISGIIEKYLSDIYAPSKIRGRYDYLAGESFGGLVVYDDKFAYSHHATDPASGKLCNAFDLVRMHLGDGQYDDTVALFNQDNAVTARLLAEKQAEAIRDFADWHDALTRNKRGEIENTLHNATLILQNDLKGITFNQLADAIEIVSDLPWEHLGKYWRDADDAQLTFYLNENYAAFSERNILTALAKVADDRRFHPIRDYFASLPPWDGVPRVDRLLIDYLGAADTEYTRAVTRKTLCAAVARIEEPGIKFDHILVLNGQQGIGKSTLIARLGGDWYSDSLTLTDMNDKTAAEKLQGYWIIEIGELAGMKKADIDKVKAFISRQDDKYRASFSRRVTPHPRNCVFFGTTNAENGYLRDVTGNRRFWTVKVGGGDHTPWELTSEDVGQIWAEAIHLWQHGEKLYLDARLEEMSRQVQLDAMEADEREGLVRAYLETPLPRGWDELDLEERQRFLDARGEFTYQDEESKRRETVSNMEIWCECFGHRAEDFKSRDAYEISAMMARMEGWERSDERQQLPIYGRQRVYCRK